MSNILMYKKTRAEIDDIPIREGNILFDTTNKNILVDDNGTRESFGGGSGSAVIDKTQAEYEALPPSKLTDGNIYHITDLDALPTTASTVSLDIDGTKSNVQEGFNTLNNNLTTITNEPFRFDKQDGKYGYVVKEADTDVFVPFKSTNAQTGTVVMSSNSLSVTFDEEFERIPKVAFIATNTPSAYPNWKYFAYNPKSLTVTTKGFTVTDCWWMELRDYHYIEAGKTANITWIAMLEDE